MLEFSPLKWMDLTGGVWFIDIDVVRFKTVEKQE